MRRASPLLGQADRPVRPRGKESTRSCLRSTRPTPGMVLRLKDREHSLRVVVRETLQLCGDRCRRMDSKFDARWQRRPNFLNHHLNAAREMRDCLFVLLLIHHGYGDVPSPLDAGIAQAAL